MTKVSLQVREDEQTLSMFETDAGVDTNGVVRWKTSKKVPFSDVLILWHQNGKKFNLELSLLVRKAEDSAVIERYRQNRAARSPERIMEERAEARIAFGPGTKVVNALTGESFTT